MHTTIADSHAEPCSSLLLTDLYQLTMLDAYHQQGMNGEATFDLFVRRLPRERNFLLAGGIGLVAQFLQQARFSEAELSQLDETGMFSSGFLDMLRDWRFSGELWAQPEGSVCFAQQPLLRVTAPLIEAQLIETRLINLVHYSTMVASKAARCVLAAPPEALLVDFGLRRAHGAEAGMLAARASYLAGFAGTATVLAGLEQQIPLFGTMAHSYVQACDSEADAFAGFVAAQYRARNQPTTLLIDTYDTEQGARRVAELAGRLAACGQQIGGVRIDSGDLAEHARAVRQILDSAGHPEIRIFASGNLDEYALERLNQSEAPIDGFGVGTHLAVCRDSPTLDCVYKLAEYSGSGRRKRAEFKSTFPGKKQVWRRAGNDCIGLAGESMDGQMLLQQMMRSGKATERLQSLEQARAFAARQLAALPEELRQLKPTMAPYPVTVSKALREAARVVDDELEQRSE